MSRTRLYGVGFRVIHLFLYVCINVLNHLNVTGQPIIASAFIKSSQAADRPTFGK